MDIKQMYDQAWESMTTGKRGFLWNYLDNVSYGGIELISRYPDGLKFSTDKRVPAMSNFSFKNPSIKPVAKENTVILVKDQHSRDWCLKISLGKYDLEGRILARSINGTNEYSWSEWKPLNKNGMPPKDLHEN